MSYRRTAAIKRGEARERLADSRCLRRRGIDIRAKSCLAQLVIGGIDLVYAENAVAVSLGPRILRAETAALAGLAAGTRISNVRQISDCTGRRCAITPASVQP